VWNKADLWPGELEWVQEESMGEERQLGRVWTTPQGIKLQWADVVRDYSVQMRRDLKVSRFSCWDGWCAGAWPTLAGEDVRCHWDGLNVLLRAIDETLSQVQRKAFVKSSS